ncbi:MAG: class I SAM-dependent methyltransferase [Candidatus Burarchaeum sp.]|nr:class I SAM-dependent methyltransferase [Candidatus Burarchaeum sp.]MDO8339090.1 class I SAM-dependent methyltransferase [Candidatus Burarchaeum sp.]
MAMNPHYWNKRYERQGRIYGRDPSELAKWAMRNGVLARDARLLETGCGTGRNSIFFAKHGLDVTGVDFSPAALALAKEDSSNESVSVTWLKGDMTNLRELPQLQPGTFNAAFSNFCLHLFSCEERTHAVQELHRVLADDGVLIASLLSTSDADYGKGAKRAYNTFELEPGKPQHFFTRQEAEALFMAFRIGQLEEVREMEAIVSSTCETAFWRLVARKRG